jgi:Holliday junction resolvase RusA-like endonuclease
VIQDIPPVTLPKERNKFLKSRKNIRYKLLVRVNRDRDTGDIDNFCKTAMDALQGSGIVFNDKEIIWIDALVEKKMDCEEPSIRIVLEQI